ncbi:MAG: DUF2116 family Zn-ribbon domain-containing protein [Candidatus Bathyarchaeia archaeon]
MVIADEAYTRHCSNCGKRIKRPILYRGYVFCSKKCRESFVRRGEKTQT